MVTNTSVGTMLQALADPTRLHTVELLSKAPMRAGELSGALGVSPPTLSKHLRVLLLTGVVTAERPSDDARTRVFHLRRESVLAVQAWLDQLKAGWDEQLGAFKAHVEQRGSR